MRTACVLGVVFTLFALPVAQQIERFATPSDIEANWNLVEPSGANASACPNTITHTSWMRISPSTVSLPHNTILENEVRCDGFSKQPTFLMYLNTQYNKDLTPIGDVDPLPQRMKQIITTTGPNIVARNAILATGEQFLMGYESHHRWCKGAVFFANGTTSYLFRPFTPFTIPNISTPFVPATKYLLMIPLFKATTCVYSARLRVAVEVPTTILPPESPDPTVDPNSDPTPEGPTEPVGDDDQGSEDEPRNTPDMDDDDAAVTDESDDEGDDEDADDADDDVCFPASAKVSLLDGSTIRISDLQLGDQVLVSKNTYSKVFAFSHRDKHVYKPFYTLRSQSGNLISATKGHYIYADHQLLPIEAIKIGQMLHTVSGLSPVISVITERMSGLYNPQTEHGDIVVNGVIASTYTRSLVPSVAHAALTPLRAISKICRGDILAALIDSGVKTVPGRSLVRAV